MAPVGRTLWRVAQHVLVTRIWVLQGSGGRRVVSSRQVLTSQAWDIAQAGASLPWKHSSTWPVRQVGVLGCWEGVLAGLAAVSCAAARQRCWC